MFGSYQAGVWHALADSIQFDVVVGASVGSLNGSLIARGTSGADLVERWRDIGDVANVRWTSPRYWSKGCFDSQPLHLLIRELCSAGPFQQDFGVVVTELPSLRPRLFQGSEVDWRHIAASCAVPAFLPTIAING